MRKYLNKAIDVFRGVKETAGGKSALEVLQLSYDCLKEDMLESSGDELLRKQGAAKHIKHLLTSLRKDKEDTGNTSEYYK